jgi:hypothetical protein
MPFTVYCYLARSVYSRAQAVLVLRQLGTLMDDRISSSSLEYDQHDSIGTFPARIQAPLLPVSPLERGLAKISGDHYGKPIMRGQ